MLKDYRLIVLLKSSLKKEQKDKLLADIGKWANADEKKQEVSDLGEKKLAYPIKKNKTAEYVQVKFQTDKLSTDLDKRLLFHEDVVRHLLIRE